MSKKIASFVNIGLTFDGDPIIFWEKLKEIKKYCEDSKIGFYPENVQTIEHED